MNDALVLWSGGCDSTLVLYDLLKEGRNVRTISITNKAIGHNVIQAKARKKMILWFKKWLRKTYGQDGLSKRKFSSFEVNVESSWTEKSSSNAPSIDPNGQMAQPPLWVSIASLYLKEKEDLYVGWLRGDDIWHYRNTIFDFFDYSANRMLYKKSEMLAPLEWSKKTEIIERLKKISLYDMVVWCEDNDKKQPCNSCTPCVTHNMALWEIEKRITPKEKRKKKS